MFNNATYLKNVEIISYTPFEPFYVKTKGIELSNFIIKPSGGYLNRDLVSSIPSEIDKSTTFYIPSYHNDTILMNLSSKCSELGIKNYCGRYNGPEDLKDFKGIIHIPYSWSNFALFENIKNGVPYFVPSQEFITKLNQSGNFWWPNSQYLFNADKKFDLSEWYCDEHKDIITYFDSWEDLKKKIETMDFVNLRKKIKAHGDHHNIVMLERWKSVFDWANNF